MERFLPVNMTRAFAIRLTPSELSELAMLPLTDELGSSPLLPSAWSFSPPVRKLTVILLEDFLINRLRFGTDCSFSTRLDNDRTRLAL